MAGRDPLILVRAVAVNARRRAGGVPWLPSSEMSLSHDHHASSPLSFNLIRASPTAAAQHNAGKP